MRKKSRASRAPINTAFDAWDEADTIDAKLAKLDLAVGDMAGDCLDDDPEYPMLSAAHSSLQAASRAMDAAKTLLLAVMEARDE